LIALVLTTKNKETKHHIHPKLERETEKAAIPNRTIYTLIWYAFYDLRSGNRARAILTAAEPRRGRCGSRELSCTVLIHVDHRCYYYGIHLLRQEGSTQYIHNTIQWPRHKTYNVPENTQQGKRVKHKITMWCLSVYRCWKQTKNHEKCSRSTSTRNKRFYMVVHDELRLWTISL